VNSLVRVTGPAATCDLVSLDDARAELGTKKKDDRKLKGWITDASTFVADYLGRTLATETVTETFRLHGWPGRMGGSVDHVRDHARLRLSRFPLISVGSIVVDNVTLAPDLDWESDDDAGFLFRLDNLGNRMGWYGQRIVVTYTAGYDLPDGIDRPIRQACMILLRHRLKAGDRDLTVRAENVPGVLETQYWVGGLPGDNAAIPPEAAALLAVYRELRVD
jgi:hypothetical protein